MFREELIDADRVSHRMSELSTYETGVLNGRGDRS